MKRTQRQNTGRGGGREWTQAGRGGGRNNRGWDRRRQKNSDQKEEGKKKPLFRTLNDTSHPENTFKNVVEDLENNIATDRMFKDVTSDAQHIVRELELPVDEKKPPIAIILTQQDEADDVIRTARQSALKEAHTMQLKHWNERVTKMPDVMQQIRAKILEQYCTTDMRDEIKKETDFDTTLRCPIELLKRIRQLMESGSARSHECTVLVNILTEFFTCKQKKGTKLLAFKKIFEARKNAVENAIGTEWIEEFAKKTEAYKSKNNSANQDQYLKTTAINEFYATLFAKNADQTLYGKKIKEWAQKYANEEQPLAQRDDYPKHLDHTFNIFNIIEADQKKIRDTENKERFARNQERAEQDHDGTNDHNNNTHESENNNNSPPVDSSNDNASHVQNQNDDNESHAQRTSTQTPCGCCGNIGHPHWRCAARSTLPREYWARPKNYDQDQAYNASHQQNNTNGCNKLDGMHWNMIQRKCNITPDTVQHKSPIILDSGSTFSMYKNTDHIIPGSERRVDGEGFRYGTNTGYRVIQVKFKSKHFTGKKMLDPAAMSNLESISQLVREGYTVYMNTDEVNAFKVSKENKIWNFPEIMGMYTYIEGVDDENPAFCGIQTVDENLEGFTKEEIKRANQAIRGFHMSELPSLKKFQLSIRAGTAFTNCPISEADVKLAQRALGPQGPPSISKGKRTRPTPTKVITNEIEIPNEITRNIQELDLYMDLIFVNNTVGLTARDSKIKARHYVSIPTKTKDSLYAAVDVVTRPYNRIGTQIRTIHCDQEFKPLMNPVQDDMNIDMNYTSTGEHQPHAERNNRYLKERIRVKFQRMPFKATPKVLTTAVCKYVAERSNWYPPKGGISSHFSPKKILTR